MAVSSLFSADGDEREATDALVHEEQQDGGDDVNDNDRNRDNDDEEHQLTVGAGVASAAVGL